MPPSPNSTFCFSVSVLVVVIAGTLYLFVSWLRDRGQKLRLLWAVGLLCLYAFQSPFLMANAGFGFAVTDFNLFYAITTPLSFLGLLFIYWGILSVSHCDDERRINICLGLWFLASVAVSVYAFVVDGGYFTSHVIQVLPSILFFLPIQTIIFITLFELLRRPDWSRDPWRKAGTIVKLCGVGLSFALTGLALYRTLSYPPQFWFISIGFFDPIYFLEGTCVFLLLVGFLMVNARPGATSSLPRR